MRGIVLLLVTLILPTSAWACSCNRLSLETEYKDASVVFVGRIVSAKQYPTSANNPRYITEEAVLLVERPYKGVTLGDHVSIKSELGPGPCGKSLRNDPVWLEFMSPADEVKFADTWLVFGYGMAPFELSLCSTHTVPTNLGSAEVDMSALSGLKARN